MIERPPGGSRRGASAFPFPLVLIVPVLALSTACGRPVTLQHTLDSPRAVAQAVVDGLTRKDVAALERLAVSEEEFRYLVWPRQPAARPGRNIPWDYAWQDLSSKSQLQLRGRVREWPARDVTLVDIDFEGETTDYHTYRIRRRSVVTLRDRGGQQSREHLFGSLIEQDGKFKVFSYVVD
jgi:hypothetical protein